jgi:hypothetical protein
VLLAWPVLPLMSELSLLIALLCAIRSTARTTAHRDAFRVAWQYNQHMRGKPCAIFGGLRYVRLVYAMHVPRFKVVVEEEEERKWASGRAGERERERETGPIQ